MRLPRFNGKRGQRGVNQHIRRLVDLVRMGEFIVDIGGVCEWAYSTSSSLQSTSKFGLHEQEIGRTKPSYIGVHSTKIRLNTVMMLPFDSPSSPFVSACLRAEASRRKQVEDSRSRGDLTREAWVQEGDVRLPLVERNDNALSRRVALERQAVLARNLPRFPRDAGDRSRRIRSDLVQASAHS